MTVTHVVPALFGPGGIVGGAERYAFELARHMADVTPTRLLTFGDHDEEQLHGRLRVRVIGPAHYIRGQRSNPFVTRLIGAVRDADVVHCHQQHVFASSLTAAIRCLARRPVFVTDLGGGGWDVSGYVSTDGWFDGHLHISEYSRAVFGHSTLATAQVIWGGVDAVKFSPIRARAACGPVIYVGRVLPHKGIDYLIRGLPEGVSLEVVGHHTSAPYSRYLRELAGGKLVTFVEGLDDVGLVAAYRRASCVVLPSVYRDAFGNESRVPELLGQTLLEGMACALPAITTDVASLPEVVEHGVTGFVVPPNDSVALGQAVRRILDAAPAAERLGAAGRLRAIERFSWSAVVRRCLAAYGGVDSVAA